MLDEEDSMCPPGGMRASEIVESSDELVEPGDVADEDTTAADCCK